MESNMFFEKKYLDITEMSSVSRLFAGEQLAKLEPPPPPPHVDHGFFAHYQKKSAFTLNNFAFIGHKLGNRSSQPLDGFHVVDPPAFVAND